MPDLLENIRQQIGTRLAELRPLVDEHRRLDAALQALSTVKDGETANPASPNPPAQAARRARRATPARPRKRAPRGANRQAALRAVRERPGATSAELAAASGVERKTLNTLLARLVKEGEVQTRALPTGRRGYALSAATPGASADAVATGG